MAGSAFASGERPLDPPRMTPKVYEHVKSKCTAALRELYICVASPIEGPEKQDFGDIDILVTWEKAAFQGKHGVNTVLTAAKERSVNNEHGVDDEGDDGVDDEEGQERASGHSVMSRDEARQAIQAALGAEYTIFSKVGDHYMVQVRPDHPPP